MKESLTIVKVGGKIVEDESSLQQLLHDFSALPGFKLLVHGGGRSATRLANQMGVETHMVAYAYATETTVGGYSIKPLLDCFTIVMIPCSNPDGRLLVLSGYDTKNNGNGVNLNRNFPTNWVYDSSGLYGSSAGSEPETRAILEVLGRYPFELVLDCHTSGNVVYYADYDCSSELRNRSYSIATALSQESGYRLYLYEASAGMANYARHPYGVPGLTIEMYPYTSGVIDCTRFSEWVWPKLDTMPAIAMSYLK